MSSPIVARASSFFSKFIQAKHCEISICPTCLSTFINHQSLTFMPKISKYWKCNLKRSYIITPVLFYNTTLNGALVFDLSSSSTVLNPGLWFIGGFLTDNEWLTKHTFSPSAHPDKLGERFHCTLKLLCWTKSSTGFLFRANLCWIMH